MKTKHFFSLAIYFLFMLLSLTSCSNDDKEENTENSELIGTWKMQGYNITATFYQNGTFDWDGTGKYTYKDGILRLKYDGDYEEEVEEYKITIKENKLKLIGLGDSDNIFIFYKESSNDDEDSSSIKSKLIGTWHSSQYGTITFYNSGSYYWSGEKGKYTLKNDKLQLKSEDGEIDDFDIYIKDDRLTLTYQESPNDYEELTFYREETDDYEGEEEEETTLETELLGTWYSNEGSLIFKRDGKFILRSEGESDIKGTYEVDKYDLYLTVTAIGEIHFSVKMMEDSMFLTEIDEYGNKGEVMEFYKE